MKTYSAFASLLLVPAACGAEEAPKPKPDLIILDEQGVRNLRLETREVEEAEFEQTILALGHIAVFPGNLHVVSSRIPGRATAVRVKIDQAVQAGQEVVVVESRQPGDPPPSVSLKAPIAGLVATLGTAPGKPVSPDDALLEIVDLSEVHAIAKVPEHFVGRLRLGQRAHIRVAAFPDRTFQAKLEHLGVLADELTGTLEAAFHVENPEGLLRPGMRAEFRIVTSSRSGVLAVPREAVQGEGAARFVYVADYELKNAFERVPVEIGEQNDAQVEIVGGLFPGDTVVTRGAYALGFAGQGNVSLKEAMDAAHGHPHAEDGSELTGEEHEHGHGPEPGHGPEHGGGGPRLGPLGLFFAGLSALLLVLLVLSVTRRTPPAAAPDPTQA
jgi:multidrug efflux pump subunit AcrA (membrane-fusion protein)